MKKKLNLLWNLKFNFFSVAERPLTFFAYFLNAKKVGRRRLVIGPAKAGAFLFSHTRLPFPPRPLLPFGLILPAAKPGWPVIGPTGADVLPFPSRLRRAGAPTAKPRPLLPSGRISPAAKPGWPVTGPAFWVCRAKSRAAFRCAKPPCAVVRFAAMASPPRTAVLPFPSRLRRAGAPTAKTRRSSAYASVSPAAKPRVRSSAPPGPMFWPTPLSLRSSVAPRPTTRTSYPIRCSANSSS